MSLEKRVQQLEEQVADLQQQMAKLQQPSVDTERKKRKASDFLFQKEPVKREHREQPAVVVEEQSVPAPQHVPPTAPTRSLEERLSQWLPKLFMVILVLGVLWGLKLMSDYGMFTNGMKIASAYVLSISMIAGAYWKKETWQATGIDALFGGAFIVGILTTAAAAILYGLFSETVALVIACLYIVYGIAIAYMRRNEALTSFVLFTSLLLPYLLEYMDMSYPIIFSYIIVMFAIMQVVIMKYAQWYALCIGFMMSIIATWSFSANASVMAVICVLLIIMIAVVTMMWTKQVPSKISQSFLPLLFIGALGVWLLYEPPIALMLSVTVLMVGCAIWLYHQKQHRGTDIFILIASLLFGATWMSWTFDEHILLFVLPLISLVCIISSIKYTLPLTNRLHVVLFILMSIVVYQNARQSPQDAFDHLAFLLVIGYGVMLYEWLVKQPEKQWGTVSVKEVASVGVLSLAIGYSFVLNAMFNIPKPYVAFIIQATYIALVYVLPSRYRTVVLIYGTFAMALLTSFTVSEAIWSGPLWLHAVMQLVVLAFVIALMYGVLTKAIFPKIPKQVFVIGASVYALAISFNFLRQLVIAELFSHSVELMCQTFVLFMASLLSFMLAKRFMLPQVRYMALALLVIALGKLIFVDLFMLNIVVRALLCLIVGAIGFVITSRMRKK